MRCSPGVDGTSHPPTRSERWLRRGCAFEVALLLAIAATQGTAQEPAPATERSAPFRLGVVPYASPVLIESHFERLVTYLVDALGHDVVLEPAPDYDTFLQRAEAEEFDFLYLPKHLSVLLEERGPEYRAVADAVTPPNEVLVAVLAESPITSIEALKGRRISSPPRLSAISIQGIDLLRQAGLDPERDLEVTYHAYSTEAIMDLISGDAVALVASSSFLDMMTDTLSREMRPLAQRPSIVEWNVVASAALPRAQVESLQHALVTFADRPGGFAGNTHLVFRFRAPQRIDPAIRRQLLHLTREMIVEPGADAP